MECTAKISKAGRNLFARVPDERKGEFGRGDKVKIVILEKAIRINKIKIKKELKEFLKKPNGKLKGTMLGYPIEIPLAKLIRNIAPSKAEKLFEEAIIEDGQN